MKIVSISDVHIKSQDDKNAKLFLTFLNSDHVKEATHIVLLGDIFDLLVGNKQAYMFKMTKIFSAIEKAASDKKLIYISGNHDFSIRKILEKKFKRNDFLYSETPIIIENNNRTIYLSHGDEVDYKDHAYIKWKKIYSSKLFQILIDKILPYSFIDWLGSRASKNSRNRGSKKFDYNLASQKYSKLVKEFVDKKEYDFYILGHTHIEYEDAKVANNGFFPHHKSFVVYENNSLYLQKLR